MTIRMCTNLHMFIESMYIQGVSWFRDDSDSRNRANKSEVLMMAWKAETDSPEDIYYTLHEEYSCFFQDRLLYFYKTLRKIEMFFFFGICENF